MTFDLLAKPVGTVDLLLHLLRSGRSTVSEILSQTGMNTERFYNAAERLESLGYAYPHEEAGGRVYLALTRAGEEIARMIQPAAEALSTTAAALERELDGLEAAADPATMRRRAELLRVLADMEFEAGRWGNAEAHTVRLLELARGLGDPTLEADTHLVLGRLAQRRDRAEEATRELEEAVRLAGATGPLGFEAEYLIASALERKTRWAEASARFTMLADRATQAADRLWAARARLGIARVLGRQGRLEGSLVLHREVVAELEELRADEDLPRAYASLGSTAYHMNRLDAAAWFEKAVEGARREGDVRIEAHALSNAAASWIDAREFRRAETALRRAIRIFEGLGERSGLGAATLNLANLFAAQDRWSEAEDAYDKAEGLAREAGDRFQEASVLFNRGQMMKRRGRPVEARALLSEAKRLFTELGSATRAARCEEELRDLTARGTR